MKRLSTCFLLLICCGIVHAQNFKVTSGDLAAINNVKRFKVLFEYPASLKVRNTSEKKYLKVQAEKKEKKEAESGSEFIQLWYKNRAAQYQPTFIQEFNSFNLDGNQLTVAQNIERPKYVMVIKTTKIVPGYSDLFYVQAGEAKFDIQIYAADKPEIILCRLKTKVRGNSVAKEFERIRTTYGNLGNALSKYLNRKALVKK